MLEETQARLGALEELDNQITEILAQGSRVVSALVAGKRQDNPTNREAFTTSIASYNELVNGVNKRLCREVTDLYGASQTTLLPANAPVQAVAFGALKESELWKLAGIDSERYDEEMVPED